MPIYEYRCKSCGRTLEVIQKIGDKPLTKCTECSGSLEKLISRSAFQLKGGGWYNEGYGGKGGASPASSEPPTKSGESSESGSNGGKKKAAAGGCGSGACGCH
ncbi:MAG TPA: zinc ribbon domain-containing protein [Candidatus Polarisedimenticolaceae bacterium]|nr:zinc ribbon domain-containing protein [Candidatus Polarisedimenticolaceae bacterium]